MLHRLDTQSLSRLRNGALRHPRAHQGQGQVLHHFLYGAVPEQAHPDGQPQRPVHRQLAPAHLGLAFFTAGASSKRFEEPFRLHMLSEVGERLGVNASISGNAAVSGLGIGSSFAQPCSLLLSLNSPAESQHFSRYLTGIAPRPP